MVIQRWQSVLLLVAAVVMAVFSFCSLGQIQTELYSFNLTTCGIDYEGIATDGAPTGFADHTWYFFALSLVSAIIPLIAIFCFKNFKLQKSLCLIEVLMLIAVIATGAVIGYNTIPGSTPSWSTVIVCPFLALIADIMAWNRIKADERLLKSADRLR